MPEQPSFNRAEQSIAKTVVNEGREIAQYVRLRDIFALDSVYSDLFNNMYKYADQITIPRSVPEKNREIFEQIKEANKLIDAVLHLYVHTKKETAGIDHQQKYSLITLDSEIAMSSARFVNHENKQLNVDKLCSLFEWSLNAWDVLGEKYGRPSTVTMGEVSGLVEDLREVLNTANGFR